jgi:hypothetical protein
MNRFSTIASDEGRVTSDVKAVLPLCPADPPAWPNHFQIANSRSPINAPALVRVTRLGRGEGPPLETREKAPPRGGKRGQGFVRVVQVCENFMVLSHFARLCGRGPGASTHTLTHRLAKGLCGGRYIGAAEARHVVLCWFFAVATPFVYGQTGFMPQGGEYGIAGTLPGDQVFPALSLKPAGGYVVWQDNRTDGDGQGISALRLDSSFSATLSSFRVNQQGALDQVKPAVSLLNDGGAVFTWQGGRQGFQRIYARFLSSTNTWATDDFLVNTFTNTSQLNPVVATLADGNVVVVWGSFDQESAGSLQGVYAQRLSPAGQKLGGEFRVNQFTPFNQRSAALAPLSDGRFIVVWVSEQQRFENSVDIYGRLYNANGIAAGDEFLVSAGTNVCATPSVAPASDGGFVVAWMQKNVVVLSDSWDVFARPFSGAGFGGVVRRVNTQTYGDQYAPKISAIGSDYLVVWTSLGQDGSREGVYGQLLRSDGSLAGAEFRVNTTTLSQQMHPALASDGTGRFLAVWTSFIGGAGSFDLFAQRYASTGQQLPAPERPFVNVLSSNSLSVTWSVLAGFSVAHYEVYTDGTATPAAVVTDNLWTATGLAPGSTHYFRLAFVLTDGRRSPLSEATTNTTYGALWYYNVIPSEWMAGYWGTAYWTWPDPASDSDGDGASNREEFLAGTDPTNPDSVLRIRLQPTPQGLFLNWNTQIGLMYQVQTAPQPGGAWTNLGGQRLARGLVDSLYVGGNTTGYYRIVRLR